MSEIDKKSELDEYGVWVKKPPVDNGASPEAEVPVMDVAFIEQSAASDIELSKDLEDFDIDSLNTQETLDETQPDTDLVDPTLNDVDETDTTVAFDPAEEILDDFDQIEDPQPQVQVIENTDSTIEEETSVDINDSTLETVDFDGLDSVESMDSITSMETDNPAQFEEISVETPSVSEINENPETVEETATPSVTEQEAEAQIDTTAFEDGEIDLDAFMSDDAPAPESSGTPDGEVDMSAFMDDASSAPDGDIDLSAFMGGGDSPDFGNGDIDLEAFMGSEGFASDKQEQEEIEDTDPLDIDLDFETTEVELTDAEATGDIPEGAVTSSVDVAMDETESVDFDALFDDIVDETPESEKAPEPAAPKPEMKGSTEEIDLSDFGFEDDSDNQNPILGDGKENKPKHGPVDYEMNVDDDDNPDDTTSVASGNIENEASADDDGDDDINVDISQDSEKAIQKEQETDLSSPDDSFDIDSILNSVEDESGETVSFESTDSPSESSSEKEVTDNQPMFLEQEQSDSGEDPKEEFVETVVSEDFLSKSMEAAEYEEPVFEEPIIDETAVTDSDISQEPIVEEFSDNTSESPIEDFEIEEPAIEETAAEETVIDEPVIGDFEIEEPVIEEPAAEETVIEEPVIEESAVDEPVISDFEIEEPVIEETAAEETVIEEPVIEESAVEEPAIGDFEIEEPVIEDPVIEETAAEETVIDEPVIGDFEIEEPVIEETAVEETVIEEPVIEESAVDEPVIGDFEIEEPVIEDINTEGNSSEEDTFEEPVISEISDESSIEETSEAENDLNISDPTLDAPVFDDENQHEDMEEENSEIVENSSNMDYNNEVEDISLDDFMGEEGFTDGGPGVTGPYNEDGTLIIREPKPAQEESFEEPAESENDDAAEPEMADEETMAEENINEETNTEPDYSEISAFADKKPEYDLTGITLTLDDFENIKEYPDEGTSDDPAAMTSENKVEDSIPVSTSEEAAESAEETVSDEQETYSVFIKTESSAGIANLSETVSDSSEEEAFTSNSEIETADTEISAEQNENTTVSSSEETMDSFDSTAILSKISQELASLRTEIKDLKSEFEEIKKNGVPENTSEEIESPFQEEVSEDNSMAGSEVSEEVEIPSADDDTGFFNETDEDDTIALSGDELSNILNTAEFTSQNGETLDEGLKMDINDENLSEPVFDEEPIVEESADESDEEISVPTVDDVLVESSSTDLMDNTVTDDTPAEEVVLTEDDIPSPTLESLDLPEYEEDKPEELTDDNIDFLKDSPLEAVEEEEEEENLETGISEQPVEGVFNNWDAASEITEETVTEPVIEEPVIEEAISETSVDAEIEEPVFNEPAVDDSAVSIEEPKTESSGDIPASMKEEIKSVLSYMDQLLENLPEDKIAEFAQSEQFETYKKLFAELGLS